MAESTQHKLDRIRPPRVQITYDVETRGSSVKMELPFVVGIMADLSTKGGAKDKQHNPIPLRDKKYMEIDRDNFDDIMNSVGPEIDTGSTTLRFKNLEDFTPIRVLQQIEANADFETRSRLSDMAAKLDGNVPLQTAFRQMLIDGPSRADFVARLKKVSNIIEQLGDEDQEPKSEIERAQELKGLLQSIQKQEDEARQKQAAELKAMKKSLEATIKAIESGGTAEGPELVALKDKAKALKDQIDTIEANEATAETNRIATAREKQQTEFTQAQERLKTASAERIAAETKARTDQEKDLTDLKAKASELKGAIEEIEKKGDQSESTAQDQPPKTPRKKEGEGQ